TSCARSVSVINPRCFTASKTRWRRRSASTSKSLQEHERNRRKSIHPYCANLRTELQAISCKISHEDAEGFWQARPVARRRVLSIEYPVLGVCPGEPAFAILPCIALREPRT